MKIYFYSGYLKGLAFIVLSVMAFVPSVFAQWSSPQTLFQGTAVPEPGPFWVSPVIVTEKDPSGVIHLVWTNKVTDERNVLAHASYANGVWSQMEILPSDVNSSAMVPSIAISSDGRLHVTYTCFLPNGSWGIVYTSKPTGGQWSQPVLVSGNEYLFNAYPQLFIDAQQDPHVIYVAYAENGESTLLKHIKFSASNPAQVTQLTVPANTDQAFNPRVVKSQDGTIHCFWYRTSNDDSSIEHASLTGNSWSATNIIADSQNSSFMDESAIVPVATPSDEVYAVWYDIEDNAGNSKHYAPTEGWDQITRIDDPGFVMGSGISDNANYIHLTGNVNDLMNDIYDLKYHFFNGTQWTHEIIEQSTSSELPAFPALAINGDTLFCFYTRVFESGGSELAMSYRILDHLTPVANIPVNKEIALKVSPNPFHSSSVISFVAGKKGEVRFILTDALGRNETASIQVQETGVNAINLHSIFPRAHRKGVYILKIVTPYGTDAVTLIK
ncbi:MAG TPA: T9SS type A sorting domain-containing protein [Lentimicrobium sp.]|nr:T9SS type A sorting domain-containing protein [Lentimicrobium sp.]